MSIEWTPNLSTGIDWQDEEHKELFRRFDALFDATYKKNSEYTLEETFRFLDTYVLKHFYREEQYMNKLKYKKIDEHREEHNHFIDTIKELKEETRLGVNVTLKVRSLLIDWFKNHIGTVDQELAHFLKENGL